MYRTARNPHSFERYTGGSSSGPAALVASGICSAAVGTDGGGCVNVFFELLDTNVSECSHIFIFIYFLKAGSVRIPSSLCGIVGLKTTFARTDMTGYYFFGPLHLVI